MESDKSALEFRNLHLAMEGHWVHVSEKERQQQYDIELKQREFERQIRKCKADGKLLEGAEAQKQRLKAKQLTLEYQKFCVDNGRAFYKSRIVI